MQLIDALTLIMLVFLEVVFSGGGKFDSHPSPLYFKKDLSNNVKQIKYFES